MRARLLLLLTPVPALVIGAAVAARSGVSPLAFAPNAAAAVLGALAAATLTGPMKRHPLASGLVALAAMAATLAFEGAEGVHRWIQLGPVRLNASAAFAPLVLMALSTLAGRWALGLGVAAFAIHVTQPDAGQQTALAAGIAVLLVGGSGSRGPRLVLGLVLVLSVGWAWLRRDPLAPVPHVEETYGLALSAGPAWAAAMALAGILLVAPLAVLARRGTLNQALAGYLVATLVMPLLGAFPVPVLGAGAGPVLGWYLALGMILRTSGKSAAPDQGG